VGGRMRPWHEVVAKIDSREAGRPASAGRYRHGSRGRWRLLCEGRLFISKVCWCTRSEDGDRRLALSPRDGHGANQAHRAEASFRRPMVEPYARCPHICPVTGFRVVMFNSGRCRRCGRRGYLWRAHSTRYRQAGRCHVLDVTRQECSRSITHENLAHGSGPVTSHADQG
jgi:hypothetical protein